MRHDQKPLALLASLALLSPLLPAGAGSEPVAVTAGATQDEEIVQEFKRYFRKYKESELRVEAVRSLRGAETVSVVEVLVPLLRDKDPEVVRMAVDVLGSFEGRPPVDALIERLLKEKKEEPRLGMLRAVAAGGYPGAAQAAVECLEDRSFAVRLAAIAALAVSPEGEVLEEDTIGGGTVEGAIELACEDSEAAVRAAALEALALRGAEACVPRGIAALGDESWRVRAAATVALSRVRSKDSIGPLIDRMQVEEGRLVADIGEALTAITGFGYKDRVESWVSFWERYEGRYELPSDEELAAQLARRAENEELYNPPSDRTTYHGIDTPSRAILFVIDVSGSMEHEVRDKERFEDGDYPSFSRMDIVKTELARTIEGLEEYVEFNIVSFATETDTWKRKLVKANVLNKDSAKTWASRLEPIGGASKQDLASVGLVASANLEGGKTNTFGALAEALGLEEDGTGQEDYETEIDTVFFLSDGRPTAGAYTDPVDILRVVREANSLRRTVIHTIAIGDFEKSFMERLAVENGGRFVDLGR